MNVLIAPDSFKGSLSSQKVAEALAKGFETAPSASGFQTRCLPLADGGEGTLEALSSVGGKWQELKQEVAAGGLKLTRVLWLSETHAAIEVAQTVGIEDIHPNSPVCSARHSGPVGEQIRTLLEKGCTELTVGLGGSCTSDGGIGLLSEIGLTLMNDRDQAMEPAPVNFERVAKVLWNPHPLLEDLKISVMCDVTNPLCGPKGACAVFGPQKGLKADEIQSTDRQIQRLHALISEKTGRSVAELSGAGAAGGLGAALLALGAELRPGAEVLFESLNLEEHLAWADLVITGEGRSDAQTLDGKLPARLASAAQKHGCPTILISGALERSSREKLGEVFCATFSICDGPIALEDALSAAPQLLKNTAAQVANLLSTQR